MNWTPVCLCANVVLGQIFFARTTERDVARDHPVVCLRPLGKVLGVARDDPARGRDRFT